MCGIAGVVSFDRARPASEAEALRMAGALRHRGPDAQTTWFSPSGRCAIGHARLSVIDLVTGDQPMVSEDGGVVVAHNGEIYNYRELRETLRELGHDFHTTSDTEVLIRGYQTWGADVVDHVDGMFAFAIWDEEAGRLVVARDRPGKKPLFYARVDGGFVFASEMKALTGFPGVDRVFDPSVLPEYLARGYVAAPRTPYRGIRKLPGGSVMVVDRDVAKESRYWTPSYDQVDMGFDDACSAVRSLTRSAVESRLVSDVPLGAFLSGGVDSSIIVGLMAELSDGPVRTFSIGFEGEASYDETHYAAMMAKRFGTEHTEFHVRGDHVEVLDELANAYDEPFADSSSLPTFVLSRLTREAVTVALTGDGGDDVFGGYHRIAGAVMAERVPTWLLAVGHGVSSVLPYSHDFRSRRRRLTRFLNTARDPFEKRLARLSGVMHDPGAILQPGMAGSQVTDPWPLPRPGTSPVQRGIAQTYESYLQEDLLVKADRCSMAHGLELRSPLLDRRLTELVFRLPDEHKVRGRETKRVLKAAFRDLVPPEVLDRRKMGFGAPVPHWLRKEWRPLVEARLMNGDAKLYRWLDADAARGLVSAHLAAKADHASTIWALLTLELWLAGGRCELPEPGAAS